MGSAEATPRPWVWHLPFRRYVPIRGCESARGMIFSGEKPGDHQLIAINPLARPDDQWAADAELIVRAVNAHDALLAFAEYVAGMDPNNRAPLFEKARAVIALARGGAEPASTNEEAA